MSQQIVSAPIGTEKPKLLDQVRHRCRARHLALSTEKTYVAWIRRFILFHNKRHPLEMAKPEVSAFLTHLAVQGHVAASTQNQALAALLFLYREVLERDFGWLDNVVRAKKPKHLPEVFSVAEAKAVIEELKGTRWLMGLLLYGGGLRLMECLRLRVKDLDFDRLQVIVREGKGEKDRVTLLAEAVVEPLKRHLDQVRKQHERACLDGYGGVELPYALARKYPDIRTVQELLGHKDIRTTQIYTHVLKLNEFAVKSPADKLWASALQRRKGGNTDLATIPATAMGQSSSHLRLVR